MFSDLQPSGKKKYYSEETHLLRKTVTQVIAQLQEQPLSNLLFLGQYAENCTNFERKSNVYYNQPLQARKS